jgi:hypothetical protein
LLKNIDCTVFVARSDFNFIPDTLPALLRLASRSKSEIYVNLDTTTPTGFLGTNLNQSTLVEIKGKLERIKRNHYFNLVQSKSPKKERLKLSTEAMGYSYPQTHCFRGYPILDSFKQFTDSYADYILHFDCDMIFYEAPNFSWIKEGIRVMEENEDILCVLPKGGPPKKNHTLNQGTTPYHYDKKRGLYLFKNFTSRHYLIHRERFLSLLPMKPLWLSWREPLKSRFLGYGKMLCWEAIVEKALECSSFWRADLMSDDAWSLHPVDRSVHFYKLLPKIIDCVHRNQFPEKQRGHFDLNLEEWDIYLKQHQ